MDIDYMDYNEQTVWIEMIYENKDNMEITLPSSPEVNTYSDIT